MKLGIMQPYFFPYIGYWQLINAVDRYVICDDVNYIKGGWINRNKILMDQNGKLINLHLHNASQNKLINQVEVSDKYIYKKKLFMILENAYSNAPYFEEVFYVINNIVNLDKRNLAKFLEFSIREVCDYLLIDTELIISSSIDKDNGLRKQDKVVELCKILDADVYINAIGGQSLYSSKDFKDREIELKFLKTGDVKYRQFNSSFVPNLSIIDVMMFNSVEEIKKLLSTYILI